MVSVVGYNRSMKITIITLFPKMVGGFFEESIVKRAKEKGAVEIEIVNLRDFASDSYGTVDDKPYGGGVGMVMKVEPIWKALQSLTVHGSQFTDKTRIIYTSPKGKQFSQKKAQEYSQLDHLVILAGHYEGVDERVIEYIDEEVSLGDFVMTGGEVTAAAIIDAVTRLIPGVLKNDEATQVESFFEIPIEDLIRVVGVDEYLSKMQDKKVAKVTLLEFPQYTRPEEFMGKKIPDILLSGDHKTIYKWRLKVAYEETKKKRPDLLMQ